MSESEIITIDAKYARRLFITKQHLAGNPVQGGFDKKITTVISDLAYVQWDPVTVVAPSHLISIWSRIGDFQLPDLEKLMWSDKKVFLHWTPIAILALMEDYPIFYSLMKEYPESLAKSWASHIAVAKEFLRNHRELIEQVTDKLKEGPAELRQFRNYGERKKSDDGWSSGNEVSTLLYHLHMMGVVMVSGHAGNQNLWSLSDDFLPSWAERKVLPAEELERLTAQRALRALGVASESDINRYFVRGRYRNLSAVLKGLENEAKILRVQIAGETKGKRLFVHSLDLKNLESVDKSKWDNHLKLISPFDNLITIRERTKRMFGFDYILEQFVPKEKRKFGTYVLPILWEDRLVGRIDCKLDKEKKILSVNSVHAEKGFESDKEIPRRLRETIEDFAQFLGASGITFGKQKPQMWSEYLS